MDSNNKEIWKDIEGYEGLYQVTLLYQIGMVQQYSLEGELIGEYIWARTDKDYKPIDTNFKDPKPIDTNLKDPKPIDANWHDDFNYDDGFTYYNPFGNSEF